MIDLQLREIEERQMTELESLNKKYGMNLDDSELLPNYHAKPVKKGAFLIDPYFR